MGELQRSRLCLLRKLLIHYMIFSQSYILKFKEKLDFAFHIVNPKNYACTPQYIGVPEGRQCQINNETIC